MKNVVTVLPSPSSRSTCRGKATSVELIASPGRTTPGFFSAVTRIGASQLGGLGAPCGLQFTNLISYSAIWKFCTTTFAYETVIPPSERTCTEGYRAFVSFLLMIAGAPQLSPFVHAVNVIWG